MKKWMGRLKWQKITGILAVLVGAVILLALSLFVAINIPYVQTFLAGKVIREIREKTGTGLSLQSVKIAFPSTVQIREVYVQDKNRDTLLCLKSLKADIGLWKLFQNQVQINSVELEDAIVCIARREKDAGFNYQFFLDQFFDVKKKPDSQEKQKKPWIFNLKEITFNKFHFTFLDQQRGVNTDVVLGRFLASIDHLDLSKRQLEIRKLVLKDAAVRIEQSAIGVESGGSGAVSAAVEATTIPGSDSSKVAFFPDWNISADQVRIENSGVRYDNNDAVRKAEGADYNHLAIKNLDGELNDIQISKEGVSAVIGSVSMKESSGFSLKELEAKVQYKNHIASVRNLRLATTASEIAGNITLEYAAPDRLTKDFANCNLILEIEKIKLNREDILLFVPVLADNPFFQKSGSSVVIANTLISGKANDLTIGNLELSLSQATNLKAHGWIKGIPDYKKMDFDLAIDQLSFTRADLFRLIDSSGFSDLKFPEAFLLKGKTAGHAGSYTANASVMTSFGDLSANLWYNDHGTALEDSFKVDFDATKILAGKIIGDSLIGKLSASGSAEGRGIRHGPLTCSAGFTIHEAEYKSYKYSGIEVSSRIETNKITATASSDDPNLKFKLKADADLNDSVKKIAASLDLATLNLKALNFTEREMAVHTGMTATLEYKDIASFKTDIELKNAGLINA
ncbi:MAG TPA: hypothetical protein VN249_11965, partial [Prolixibacteraceae bacterium]|nr:hypothetical protein [Prolixibacteraceae bacterium]